MGRIVDLDDLLPPCCTLDNLQVASWQIQALGQQLEQGFIGGSLHWRGRESYLENLPFSPDLVFAAARDYAHRDTHAVCLPTTGQRLHK